MSVGGIGGGGRGGRIGGPRGPAGKGGAGPAGKTGKAGAGTFGKVDKSESLVGPSGLASSAEAQATDPVTSAALAIAKQLKNGEIKDRDEATKKLISDILREKLRMQSKALTTKIADALQDDPRLHQALERIWAKGQ